MFLYILLLVIIILSIYYIVLYLYINHFIFIIASVVLCIQVYIFMLKIFMLKMLIFLNLDGVFLFIIFFLFFTVYLTILIKQNILSLVYFIQNSSFTLPVFRLHHYALTLIITILYLDLMGFGFCASITEIEKTNYSNLSSTNKPIYLDLNKTNRFVGDMYYFYKELLLILGTERVFSTYGIDYDVDYFFLNEYFNKLSSFYIQNNYLQQNSLFLLNNINHGSISISKCLINLDELVLDLSVATLYWSNEPTFKFYIPYPFIASGNFHYHDYWWLHISVYYYWLWFFFIYLIIFFLITVMWEIDYNITKNNPQRETRGVRRSKCGDLITACVPVSWASAIIIHESTDSIDHFDGFGTLDFVVGVRAFQWGWEYYYPNNLKINYTMSNEKNILLGNDNLINNESDEFIMSRYTKQLLMNKNRSINILPLYLITNPDLNKVYSNINKMGSFGFSKLCIYTAYKFTLQNKAINYNNILNSTVNLTNFNVKKFINHYKVDTTINALNFKQFKLPNNKPIKLFKKTYNKFDILKFNQTDSLQLTTNKLYLLCNSAQYYINFKIYTESICKFIQLNNKKLIISCDNKDQNQYSWSFKKFKVSIRRSIDFIKTTSIVSALTTVFNHLSPFKPITAECESFFNPFSDYMLTHKCGSSIFIFNQFYLNMRTCYDFSYSMFSYNGATPDGLIYDILLLKKWWHIKGLEPVVCFVCNYEPGRALFQSTWQGANSWIIRPVIADLVPKSVNIGSMLERAINFHNISTLNLIHRIRFNNTSVWLNRIRNIYLGNLSAPERLALQNFFVIHDDLQPFRNYTYYTENQIRAARNEATRVEYSSHNRMIYMELKGWDECWRRLYKHYKYDLPDTRTAFYDPNNVPDQLKPWLIIAQYTKYDTQVGWRYLKHYADIIYNRRRLADPKEALLMISQDPKYNTQVGLRYIKYYADIFYNKNKIRSCIREAELKKFLKNLKKDNPILCKYAARPPYHNYVLSTTHRYIDIYRNCKKLYPQTSFHYTNNIDLLRLYSYFEFDFLIKDRNLLNRRDMRAIIHRLN